MQLSKTDFIPYLNCAKSLWLLQNKPTKYVSGGFSAYAKKLAAEGYLVNNFIAETKGSMSTLQLREIEKSKMDCARQFFADII